jgi:hypothetical protein
MAHGQAARCRVLLDGQPGKGVPDGLPVISRGSHLRPEDGACVMEYVSVLTGSRFDDHPRCTHRALATLARAVNDCICDPQRRNSLVLLAPCLAEVGGRDREVTLRVVEACLRAAAEVSAPSAAVSRQLSRVQAQLRELRSVGAKTGRAGWTRIVLSMASAENQVASAFWVFRERTGHLPATEQDRLLVTLLGNAIQHCRRARLHSDVPDLCNAAHEG